VSGLKISISLSRIQKHPPNTETVNNSLLGPLRKTPKTSKLNEPYIYIQTPQRNKPKQNKLTAEPLKILAKSSPNSYLPRKNTPSCLLHVNLSAKMAIDDAFG
jgi:hypothetical protein